VICTCLRFSVTGIFFSPLANKTLPEKLDRLYVIAAVVVTGLVIIVSLSGRWTPPKDSRGNDLQIVSLAPSVTEMLFALDLDDLIVGVTDHCDYPPRAKKIEQVGGLGSPNIEKLIALQPDLVIATDFQSRQTAEVLKSRGIRVLDLRIRNFRETFEAFKQIGSAAGKPKRAEQVVAQMQSQLQTVTKRYKNIPTNQLPRVFVEIWNDPITTAGGTSFINDVIIHAGGINVAGGLTQAYPHISAEKVIEWNPDVIILCYMDGTGRAAAQLAGRIGWADISAVKTKRIIDDVPNDLILRPGPRLVEGVKVLAQRLGTARGDESRPLISTSSPTINNP